MRRVFDFPGAVCGMYGVVFSTGRISPQPLVHDMTMN